MSPRPRYRTHPRLSSKDSGPQSGVLVVSLTPTATVSRPALPRACQSCRVINRSQSIKQTWGSGAAGKVSQLQGNLRPLSKPLISNWRPLAQRCSHSRGDRGRVQPCSKSCLSPEALSSMGWSPRLFCSSMHTAPHPTPMPNPEPGSQVSLRNCVLNEGAEHMREEIARCRITLEIFIVASPM